MLQLCFGRPKQLCNYPNSPPQTMTRIVIFSFLFGYWNTNRCQKHPFYQTQMAGKYEHNIGLIEVEEIKNKYLSFNSTPICDID